MPHSPKAPLAIVQLGIPPAAVSARVGEQADWFIQALNLQQGEYCIIRPHLGESLPDYATLSAAILSGSWAMVTDHADWSERTAAWIRGAIDYRLPLLGVCYGHQLMAYALGGTVADNPQGWERGRVIVEQFGNSDPLLASLPTQFPVWLSHRQTVLIPPQGAQVLARSPLDACQIIRYTPEALSVQFHPEFDAHIMAACQPADTAFAYDDSQAPDWARSVLVQFLHRAITPQVNVF
ncbi:glutamine amidotransferase [[Pantoea] beijingensis]|uniref:Glutamine amidotransferase n=1 Tax=[Pantoea] beijingensis TaxID=1324864 RepID=A0A443IHB5_9GAMM|nr:glutamine amidotransferase [[Pantoea] beijingensis]RWR03420.1 glutamine amidotransferase [[Pantoea] beijingensis]